jgi:MoxR-like ATPase
VRAHALLQGRSFALPDDVKTLAAPVLGHRVRVAGSRAEERSRREALRAIGDIVERVPVPV